jgi:hypothetical protein
MRPVAPHILFLLWISHSCSTFHHELKPHRVLSGNEVMMAGPMLLGYPNSRNMSREKLFPFLVTSLKYSGIVIEKG